MTDFDEYSALKAINWSTLKELKRSPLHYRYRLANPREDSTRLALGRAAHTAVLEPDTFLERYTLYKGGIRRGKKWDEFKAQHADETILKPSEYRQCLAIRDAVRSHPVAMEYLRRGIAEQTVTWADAETGLACKGRLDWVCDTAVVDLKTTGNVDAHVFGASAARMSYHTQLAWYRDGYAAATDGVLRPTVVIAVEIEPPYDVAVYEWDEDALYAGTEEYRELLRRVRECRETDTWPGKYPEKQTLRLPRWMLDDEDETDASGMDLDWSAKAGEEGL